MGVIRLSRAGWRLVVASFVVFLLGLIVSDYFMMMLGVSAAGFLVYRYLVMKKELEDIPGLVSFSPGAVESSFTAGEEYESSLEVESSFHRSFEVSTSVGDLTPIRVGEGRQKLMYRFKPELSGTYNVDNVEAKVTGEYGLFEGEAVLGFEAGFVVYPRVVSAAVSALEFLEGAGILGGGEGYSLARGRGLEYLESREYVPGDTARQIDWKAYARLGRLIVKEFHRDESGSIHVVYESSAPDPVSGDVLSACFLRAVLSYAEAGWVIGVSVLDGGEIVMHHGEMHPSLAVGVALRHVFGRREASLKELYMVLDPVYRPRLERILGDDSLSGGVGEVASGLYGHRYSGVLYLTSLVDDPAHLLEVGHVASSLGTRMIVLEPCRPWAYSGGLEMAVRQWRHYDKVNRGLARMGVGVAVTLEEANGKLVEAVPVMRMR
ncbi:MAG: DUF58 domain-containing protein [Candidatus Bathyarchaeota archaeon]|nr:DUF58 domain-containing protein [Candidatus Bathyarchaeota archaeon]